jgi:hypothetical protein
MNYERIRSVIDTITSKVVLILGSFTPERKVVLDAIRDELRKRDYLSVLFDFEKPAKKDLTGTISTLANMARFIIADLTDPSSVPHELATVVPGTVVPVQAIILEGQREYAMFPDFCGSERPSFGCRSVRAFTTWGSGGLEEDCYQQLRSAWSSPQRAKRQLSNLSLWFGLRLRPCAGLGAVEQEFAFAGIAS